MALTGSDRETLEKFIKQVTTTITAQKDQESDTGRKKFHAKLAALTNTVLEVAKRNNAELSLQIERVCIVFDRECYAKNKDDMKRYDKQIAESGYAEMSLAFVRNPPAYKTYVKHIFPDRPHATVTDGDTYLRKR